MRFSQRIGFRPHAKLAQLESIDDDLRSSLWSLLTLCYWNSYVGPGDRFYGRTDFVRNSNFHDLTTSIWLHYFKKPADTIDEYWEDCLKHIRHYYFHAEWFEVYDFVEFISSYGPKQQKPQFNKLCNDYLERENSAYRFVDSKITEITSEQEIEEIETAMENAGPYAGVKTHLKTALALMSDKQHPDFRNSIKESISAVESLAKKIAKDDSGTLGSVLKELERSKKLHPALKSAFSSLYGYTNDADGIRHALLEETNLSKSDARFMLICCSAFINYAIEALGAR